MRRLAIFALLYLLLVITGVFLVDCGVKTYSIKSQIDYAWFWWYEDTNGDGIDDGRWEAPIEVPSKPYEIFNDQLEEATEEYFETYKRTLVRPWSKGQIQVQEEDSVICYVFHYNLQTWEGDLIDTMENHHPTGGVGSDDSTKAYVYIFFCGDVHNDYMGTDPLATCITDYTEGSDYYGDPMIAIARRKHEKDFPYDLDDHLRYSLAHELGHAFYMVWHCPYTDCIMCEYHQFTVLRKFRDDYFGEDNGHYQMLYQYLP